jgi:hypothetical protein
MGIIKMQTFTIPQKTDKFGTIYDIASALEDRVISFPKNHHYAVVLSAYYGGKGYTVHRTERTALAKSRKLGNVSHKIIDVLGNEYNLYYGSLVQVGRPLR